MRSKMEWKGTHGMTEKIRSEQPRACFCIGPQNGDPICPCGMRAKRAEEQILLAKIMEDFDLVPKVKGEK